MLAYCYLSFPGAEIRTIPIFRPSGTVNQLNSACDLISRISRFWQIRKIKMQIIFFRQKSVGTLPIIQMSMLEMFWFNP